MSLEMSMPNSAVPEFCHDIPRLLGFFEGLGDNCDLGVVQRAVGIEPFGLFRFGACKDTELVELLRVRFHPLGEPEDLWLDEVGPRREYWVKSRRCSFSAHTDRYAGRDDPEVVRAAQIEKTRYLKAKLIGNLSHGRRLFVFKGLSDIATIREIVVQLQRYGPNCLLWIGVADDAHLPGSVEYHSEGLLRGFVSRFGTYDGAPSLPVEEWVAVCANAYRLWRNADPPKAPLYNLISSAIATGSCHWFTHESAATRVLDEPAPTGGAMFEHRLEDAEATSVYRALLPIASGGDFASQRGSGYPRGFAVGRSAHSYLAVPLLQCGPRT